MQKMNHEYPVADLAGAFEVSPGGFHAHRFKAQGQRRQADGELARTIAPIFAASRQTYGCPRASRLVPRQKRKRWRPTTMDSRQRQPVAENRLIKVPAPDQPD